MPERLVITIAWNVDLGQPAIEGWKAVPEGPLVLSPAGPAERRISIGQSMRSLVVSSRRRTHGFGRVEFAGPPRRVEASERSEDERGAHSH